MSKIFGNVMAFKIFVLVALVPDKTDAPFQKNLTNCTPK